MKSTFILVADNTHARIFTAETPSSPLEEIEAMAHAEGRLHDQNSKIGDRPRFTK